MRKSVYLLSALFYLSLSCHVLINPTPEMNVKQDTTDIPSVIGEFDFGDVLVGDSSAAITFTIENTGNTLLKLADAPDTILITSGDEADFIIDQTEINSSISPNNFTNFTIAFAPTAEGEKSARVSIANNDSDENPYTFTINGAGVVPEINVKQGTTDIPSVSGINDFGDVKVGESSPEITFTIENLGTGDLNLTSSSDLIQISGADAAMFTINQTSVSTPIISGASTTFTIIFTPSSVGVKSATISIENTDSDENPYTFSLTSKGMTAPEINVRQDSTNIVSGSGSFDFGVVLVGETSSVTTFTIENSGTIDLELTGSPGLISITGTNAAMFTIDETSTNTPVTFGNTTTFTITFIPTGISVKSATIFIASNDYDENPYTFTITGTGIAPEINVKQGADNIPSGTGSYDFGDVNVGSSSLKIIFTIENLDIGNLKLTGTPKIQISGTNSSMFVIDQASTSSQVAYGNSTSFGITFSPTIESTFSVTVSIENNDLDENPYTFTLEAISKIYGWTKRLGGAASDWAEAVTIDSNGNIYLTGCFEGTVDFGADFGVTDVKTSAGLFDVFVTKINANYTYGWTKRIGGNGRDYGNSITTDSSGNVYITGEFWYTVNFGADFGATDTKISAGMADIFVIKINTNGTYAWTKNLVSSDSYETGNSITTDSSGNVYVTGVFRGSIDFGADFGVSDVKTATGNWGAYITKINSSGTYGWTKCFSSIRVGGNSVVTDSSGNIYLTGSFAGTVDFGSDFGVSDIKTDAGIHDIFVTKIYPNGSYGWTKRMGGIRNDVGYAITIDSSGNIYVTGSFDNTVNFGLDFGVTDNKTTNGSYDIFITKINANGSYGWTKQFGGTSSESPRNSILADNSGNVYLTGSFESSVDFGDDFGESDVKTSKGDSDIFLIKLTTNGNYTWTKQIGGSGADWGASLASDSAGNIFLAGGFSLTVDFGEDFGMSDSKTSAGDYDCFLTKILHES